MKGIERKIRDLKDQCSVFCCHGNVGGNEAFQTGEYNIFELPDISSFDGVVFVKNTFINHEFEAYLDSEIQKYNIPCVSIDRYDEKYVSVTSDEKGSMIALTEHMIKEHDCKKFYFVTGIRVGSDARLREEGFREAIARNGLTIEEKHVYEGNYEYRSGIAAAEYFMSLDEPMADCIVCSNDQMAVGLTMELKKHGIKVPRQVKVTGVDYDFVSRVVKPGLTTVKRQQYQKGIKAIEILHNYDQYKPGDVIQLPIMLNLGGSCGCPEQGENHNDVSDALAVDRYSQSELTQIIKNMTASFLAARDRQSLIDAMMRFAGLMKPRELYLNLNIRPEDNFNYSDFNSKLFSDVENSDYTEKVENVISLVNGEIRESGAVFNVSELFPPSSGGGREGVVYYFFPIHYLKRNFGYAIIGESGELVRNDFFPNWANMCSIAFENIRKSMLMGKMIETLDKMWIYDTLTGIYNRAGFFKLSEPIVEECIEKKAPICVIFLDVDGLKIVNDTYGHDEGDSLIKEMAEVMKKVKKHGEIVMRYGGDEFVLLAQGYDSKKAEETAGEIETMMEDINSQGIHPFKLEASIGYCLTEIKDKEELNAIIEEADKEMYKKKYVKKALKRK